jgi:hypothetical protein
VAFCGVLWLFVAFCGFLWHFVAFCGFLWRFVAFCGFLWLFVANVVFYLGYHIILATTIQLRPINRQIHVTKIDIIKLSRVRSLDVNNINATSSISQQPSPSLSSRSFYAAGGPRAVPLQIYGHKPKPWD